MVLFLELEVDDDSCIESSSSSSSSSSDNGSTKDGMKNVPALILDTAGQCAVRVPAAIMSTNYSAEWITQSQKGLSLQRLMRGSSSPSPTATPTTTPSSSPSTDTTQDSNHDTSDCTSRSNQRQSVSFGSVSIREYDQVVEDKRHNNTSFWFGSRCVSLDWTYRDGTTMTVDEYEQIKTNKQQKQTPQRPRRMHNNSPIMYGRAISSPFSSSKLRVRSLRRPGPNRSRPFRSARSDATMNPFLDI